MKISRLKKSHRTLTFFARHFNYREPYQVLIDATFCQAALKNKVFIEEQIKKYFQCPVKLLTTQCIILECESLGPQLTGATQIVKQFYVHKCGHEGKPINAIDCIKSMTKDSRYIVATQDRTLQEKLRKVPGRCLLYLHKATPVLEEPSVASKKWVHKKQINDLLPVKLEEKIQHMKQKQGIQPLQTAESKPKKKRKSIKNPNPLSCMKRKKSSNSLKNEQANTREKSKTEMKPKRKRIKVSKHVKQEIKNNL